MKKMDKTFAISLLLKLIFITSHQIDCQVVLTRQLLEEWYPENELTETSNLDLRYKRR